VTKNQLLAVLAAFFLAVGGLAAYLWMGPDSAPGATGDDAGYTLTPTDRTMGNKNAKVVLIEYAAPSCPHCAAFNETTMPVLKASYIDTGKMLYVFRVFPLRPDDGAAEKIARCLPEDKYFSFIDLLFRNQPIWDVEFGVTDVHGGLVRLGRMAGLSAEQVDKCIDNAAEDSRINAVAAEGERRYSVSATPTLILNGTKINNASPAELSKLIDAELAKSSAK
jgi:protein-disulfide isomerase